MSTSNAPSSASTSSFLGLALSGEAGLLLIAWALARWWDLAPLRGLELQVEDILWGLAATLPPVLGLAWLIVSQRGPVRDLLDLVVDQMGPFLVSLSTAELALLAAVAGFSEEVLFRGVLQVGLTDWLSPGGALLATSVVFGLVHFASRTYAVFAGVMGLYLGSLFLVQESLLAPIVTHAAYDFVALMLVARLYRQRVAAAAGLDSVSWTP